MGRRDRGEEQDVLRFHDQRFYNGLVKRSVLIQVASLDVASSNVTVILNPYFDDSFTSIITDHTMYVYLHRSIVGSASIVAMAFSITLSSVKYDMIYKKHLTFNVVCGSPTPFGPCPPRFCKWLNFLQSLVDLKIRYLNRVSC